MSKSQELVRQRRCARRIAFVMLWGLVVEILLDSGDCCWRRQQQQQPQQQRGEQALLNRSPVVTTTTTTTTAAAAAAAGPLWFGGRGRTPTTIIATVQAFTPPLYGWGAGLVFPVRNVQITTVAESDNIRAELAACADFFVDAFWSSKLLPVVSPSSSPISSSSSSSSSSSLVQQQQQLRNSLYQQQWAEFTKRYGNVKRNNSALIVLKTTKAKTKTTTTTNGGRTGSRRRSTGMDHNDNNNNNNNNNNTVIIIGTVGVEVDRVKLNPVNNNNDNTISVPLMSNLAVSKEYRRRGLAERLVQAVERLVRDGDLNCNNNEYLYLYVEQTNRAAVQLYRKMGYTMVWKNKEAVSAIPTIQGGWQTTATTVLCMKKRLVNNDKRWLWFF